MTNLIKTGSDAPPTRILITGVAVLAILIGGYVALMITGHDPTGLIAAIVTILGVLGVGIHQETRIQEQNKTLMKIDRQTNGVLDQRIIEGTTVAVHKVLADAGITTITDANIVHAATEAIDEVVPTV
jgi:hypothetical protein